MGNITTPLNMNTPNNKTMVGCIRSLMKNMG